MTHPLTDEKCNKLSIFDLDECSAAYAYGIMADMRTAYDKGRDDQLEQVIEWLNEAIFDQCIWPHQIDALPKRLQKAMRPQEES